ncbi:MAG: glycosyltransferase family 2 protein [Paludibacteraceae bacterium]
MFSVIIPLYNKAPYVEKAIRSVLVQTYQEFELIVVDDGSQDSSLEIAEKFKSSQVQIISQVNAGVSTARNNGVKLTKYSYLCFLDADDWWEPTFLEEMKMLIDEFPDAGIYGSSYYKVKNGKNIPANIGVDAGFERGEVNYFQVYAKTMWMPLTSISVVIPKKVFIKQNGFKPQLKLGEDFDLWVRIAIKYSVVLLNKPLAYYNQDVEQKLRGVVLDKIYKPETHFIFNMDFLVDDERKNKDLKQLLDKLRVYTLFRYRIQKAHPEELKKEIKKIDFKNQSFATQLQYKLPVIFFKKYYVSKRYIRDLIR